MLTGKSVERTGRGYNNNNNNIYNIKILSSAPSFKQYRDY